MRKILFILGLLLLAALFFTGMVLGGDQESARRDAPASLSAIGEVKSTDLDALTAAFGCPVPYGGKTGAGTVKDAKLGTLNARTLTWQAANGIVTTAVRPAEAAQLLRHDELTLDNSTIWTLDGRTLLMAGGEGAACAYYQDEDAAYCLYLAGADIDGLLDRLSSGVIFPQ